MAVLTRKPFFKLATYGVRLLIPGGTEAERKTYFFWLLLLCTVKLNLTSVQAYVFSFRFVIGVETDELDSNAEEFEDESVEFFIKEEITEVEE